MIVAAIPAALTLVSAPAEPRPAEGSLEAAVADWRQSFQALDLPRFLSFFAADATLFHPGPQLGSGRRVEPAEMVAGWSATFADLRARSKRTAPPFLDLQTRDLRIDRLGHDAALVTFHLGEGAWPGRRTLAWRRGAEGWRIVHLHASRLPEPPAARGTKQP